MELKALTKGIASVVTVLPRERRPVAYIQQMPVSVCNRSDREAVWGDFCAVGGDLKKASERYDRTQSARR